MTGSTPVDTFLAIITAGITLFGLYAGGRKALADARKTEGPPSTPYEALAARVTDLEAADATKGVEMNRLRKQVRRLAGVLSREVVVILDWLDAGADPPAPDREAALVRELIEDINADID